jgi:hypothetical protein
MPFCRVYKRMKGLEPSTFCMANARDVRTRSRPCAQNRMVATSPSGRANPSEPERTPNLAILATTPAGPRPPIADILRAREESGRAYRGNGTTAAKATARLTP